MDDHQPGVAGLRRRGRVDVQIAEQAPEGEMLVLAQMLVAEKDHRVFGERAMDLVDRLVAERARQVDAAHFGADDRRQFVDSDRVKRGRLVARMLVAGAVSLAHQAHRRSPMMSFPEDPAEDRVDML